MLKKLLFITAFFSFQFTHAADGPLLNWGMSLPGPNSSTVNATITDASGDVYITGSYSGTNVDFDFSSGNSTLTSIGQADVFIAKYSSTGQLLWLKSIGGTGYDYAKSLCISNGNIWLLGSFVGTIDFDPDAGVANGTSLGAQSMFVLKLNGTSGNYMWHAAFGGFGNTITSDNSGRILVVGKYSGTFDFDPGAGTTTLTSAGGDDISFICLADNGALVTAKSLGGTGNDDASSVKVGGGANA
ncbi:MAG TPA: hypothetical protein VK174_07115, partial [Chitinophagales bacterium]|nr:hypothetical protein [Chitinophagales bacterium]